MKYMNGSISLTIAFLAVTLFLLSFTLSVNAQTLYSCDRSNPLLLTIDPNTGDTLTTTDIIFGEEIRGCNGLAKDPTTGVCWIMLRPPGSGAQNPGPRILATLNPFTGAADEIGNTGLAFAGIAFDSNGTLYGLTGDQDGAAIPTIYTLSKINGTPTEFLALVNTDDGEALGFNPNDGLLYRMNGRPPINVDQIFESINPANMAVTPINISGVDQIGEETALTHLSGNTLLAADTNPDFYTLTTGGVVTFIGGMDHRSKGLAFDCVIPPSNVPTLSEWGLITTVIALGLVSFFVLRRRSALQK